VQLDSKYLSEHYASLSDEALREIDPAELVDAARKCYDEELRRRKAASPALEPSSDQQAYEFVSGVDDDGKPAWLADAACACAYPVYRRLEPAEGAMLARDALGAAGIPCYEEFREVPPTTAAEAKHELRLLVPAELELQAEIVLEKKIFNEEAEFVWRSRLERLTDNELRALPPRVAFSGLFDRIERLTRVYNEEIARRGLK